MLEELKQHVLLYAQKAEQTGLCLHKSGNFSLIDREQGLVCITPTGCERLGMQVDDIVIIDMAAQTVESKNGLRPTSEALMHLRAYQERADIKAVVHTHSKFATTFAVLKKEIPAILYEMMYLHCRQGFIPVADYARPGTRELADSVAGPLQEADALLLESHGVMTVGLSMEEAYLKACYTEELAEIYYRALTVLGPGREPNSLPAEELSKWSYPKL